jgi:hypothetical protein
MKMFAAYLIISAMLLSACKKEHNEANPSTATGTIALAKQQENTVSLSGVVKPADAITRILVTDYRDAPQNAKGIFVVPDPVTGTFKVTGLSNNGVYALRFSWAPSYRGVLDTLVKLTAGNTIDVGTIPFTSTGIYKVFSYLANGSARSLLGSATYTGSTLILSAQANFPTAGDLVYNVYKVNISLDHVTGPGIYTCRGTPASCITYESSVSNTRQNTRIWNSINAGGDATVEITSIDQATKIISGTFTGTLVPASSQTTDNQIITNGSFKITYQ